MNLNFRLIILLVLFCSGLCQADTLVMKNGDRLTGEVENKVEDKITFKTEYGGSIVIDWDQVQELKTDHPVEVMLSDETVTKVLEISSDPKPGEDIVAIDKIKFIKPDDWRKDKWNYRGNLNFALNFERGNNDNDQIDVDGMFEVRDKNDRITLRAQGERDEVQGDRTVDHGEFQAKYDRFVNKRAYVGLNGKAERDRFANLLHRYQVGPHVGYQFYDTDRFQMSGELSATRVWENYRDSTENYYYGTGWRYNVSYQIIPDALEFYHRDECLLNVEDADKYLFDAWTGLRWPIAYGFIGSIEHQFEYDSQPGGSAARAKRADNTYNVKIGYQW